MLGFAKCALLVFSAGYFTFALPLDRMQRRIEPRVNMEVIQEGPPCETGAQMGDNVLINLNAFRGTGDGITRMPKRPMQIKLGDHYMPSLEEVMVGMCPGGIRRVSITYPTTPDDQGYTDNYDMELVSIGAVIIPPEVDKNGDNIVDRGEFANYLDKILGDDTPDQAAIDEMFNGIDTSGDGVIDLSEWQAVSD